MPYLERRRNLWYAVLTIPKDLRESLGKLRFIQSLGTPDKAQATILAAPLLAQWMAQIRVARGSTNALTEEAERWKRYFPEQAKLDAKYGHEEGEGGTLELYDALRKRSEELAKTHGSGAVDVFHGIINGTHTPTDKHIPAWVAQLNLAAKTKDQMEKDIPLLVSRFSSLESITKGQVKQWLDDLTKEGKSLSSLNRILSAARNYWKYLQTHDVIAVEVTPFKDVLHISKATPKNRKGINGANLPYDSADVARLYNAALSGWGVRPKSDPSLAALIKLGAYTGARIEELCSLKASEVKSTSLLITASKTDAGIREIPIHSKLSDLITTLKEESEDGYLLSGLTFNKYGDRSNAIGKRYGRLKEALGFDGSHTFHSFRSTVVTQLENAGTPENITADIVGHDKPRITYGLYSGGTALENMRVALENVSYPI